jgi:rare lipoprotein A
MRYCLLLLGMIFFFEAEAHLNLEDKDPNIKTKSGLATYYAHMFEGRRTTSGTKYRGHKLTAAHRTLPLGTIVTVKNLSNGKTVDVVVNDRGPHTKRYIIDLSAQAAKELGFWKKGQSQVEITYPNN